VSCESTIKDFPSDIDIEQKKDVADLFYWREYEALRDHLQR
jgi:hypothetical protein